jgi:hypothetical protein
MANWLQKLARKGGVAAANGSVAVVDAPEAAPAFSTKLAVDSPGAPRMVGAEALYRKWSARWQEF